VRADLAREPRATSDAAAILAAMSHSTDGGMSSPNTDERQAQVERMERAIADAYANGHEASGYFPDNCCAEAGNTDERPVD